MNDQVVTNSKSKLKLILLAVFVIFAVLLVVLNSSGKKESEKQISQPQVVIPTPVILTEGALTIELISTDVGLAVNKAKEIEISASSNHRAIVAYDLVITYKKGGLEVLSVESLIPGFKTYSLEKNDHFIITGVKEPEENAKSVFENTPLVRLKVLPKTSSELTLNLVESLGKEKSQLVDDQSKILRPQVGKIILNAK